MKTPMKTTITILTAVALQACSTISKETYTESRTLTYPKGGKPHIKEMYLRNTQPDTVSYTPEIRRAEPVYQPNQIDFNQLQDIPKSTTEINQENERLLAQLHNNILKNMLAR